MSEEMETENDSNVMETRTTTVNQNKFNTIIVPSLQAISMGRIVTTIYKQQQVLEIIQQPGNDEKEKLSEIENHMHQQLIKLKMPCSLMDDAMSFCKFVAFQGNYMFGLTKSLSKKYGKCLCGFDFSIPVEYFGCLCFKMNCTVDKLKTFTLMSETNYPDYKIFLAASHLCSKELACKSWEKMSPNFLQGSCQMDEVLRHFQKERYTNYHCPINTYWLYFVNDKMSHFSIGIFEDSLSYTAIEHVFHYVLRYDNLVVGKYFYQLMLNEPQATWDDEWRVELEEYDVLKCWMDHAFGRAANFNLTKRLNLECFDIFFFMLSETNDRERQIELLKFYKTSLIPVLILNVSYQKFLEPVMRFIWDSLNENDFCNIFIEILKFIGRGNGRAKNVFKELWNLCPETCRKWCSDNLVRILICSCQYYKPFSGHLCDIDFFDIVKLILSKAPDDGKGLCLYSLLNYSKLRSSIIEDINYLNVIDNLLGQIILSSEEEVAIFKKCVINFYDYHLVSHWIQIDDYDSLNKYLDWALTSEIEVDAYKQNSLKKNVLIGDILKSNLDGYEKVNKFLIWCFSSQHEVDEFKRGNRFMNEVLKRILFKADEFEGAQKFVNWCLNSKSEVIKFKKDFSRSSDFTFDSFETYRKYLEWSYESEQDLKHYMESISEFEYLRPEIMSRISNNQFEYVNKLLDWCLGQRNKISVLR